MLVGLHLGRFRARLRAPISIELCVIALLFIPALNLILHPVEALLKKLLHFGLAYAGLVPAAGGLHGGGAGVVTLDILNARILLFRPAFLANLLLDILDVLLVSAATGTCLAHFDEKL